MRALSIPPLLIDRLEAAQRSPYVARWQHVVHDPVTGTALKIGCKSCGALIVAEGQPLPTFVQLQLVMSDGISDHHTHLCHDCVEPLDDVARLDALYLCDVAQWIREAETRPPGGDVGAALAFLTFRRPMSATVIFRAGDQ